MKTPQIEALPGMTPLGIKPGKIIKAIRPSGADVQIVEVKGDIRHPEPSETRVVFPGGSLSVVRTSDNKYWAHIHVNHPGAGQFIPQETIPGRIVRARLDSTDRHTSDVDIGTLGNPDVYHVAVLLESYDPEARLAEKMKPARLSPARLSPAPSLSVHTPGPWVTDGELVRQSDGKPDGKLVADCSIFFPKTNRQSENQANARLIAAAPELLTWAKELLAWEDDFPPPGTRGAEIFEALADAIAKAEGSAP